VVLFASFVLTHALIGLSSLYLKHNVGEGVRSRERLILHLQRMNK